LQGIHVPRPNSARVGVPLDKAFSSGVSFEEVVETGCFEEQPTRKSKMSITKKENTKYFLITFTPWHTYIIKERFT